MKYGAPILLVILVFSGSIVSNRVTPLVFGLPPFFVWHVVSVFLISGGMWLIYKADPENRRPKENSEKE
jgi:uncharacterized BrkB/YihY/UPF0761 family membrane protein